MPFLATVLWTQQYLNVKKHCYQFGHLLETLCLQRVLYGFPLTNIIIGTGWFLKAFHNNLNLNFGAWILCFQVPSVPKYLNIASEISCGKFFPDLLINMHPFRNVTLPLSSPCFELEHNKLCNIAQLIIISNAAHYSSARYYITILFEFYLKSFSDPNMAIDERLVCLGVSHKSKQARHIHWKLWSFIEVNIWYIDGGVKSLVAVLDISIAACCLLLHFSPLLFWSRTRMDT